MSEQAQEKTVNHAPRQPPAAGKKSQDVLRSHVFDGIQEYDNALPLWWRGLLYGTIGFAFSYLLYFHVLGGPSLLDEYNHAVAAQAKAPAATNQDELKTKLKDPAFIAEGAQLFAQNCAPCHGDKGQGVIGPNLTDDYWLHGGKPEQIEETIRNGVPDKGMPTWLPILGPAKIARLAAYVHSIHGSNPPNPKPPQGQREPYED